jgi:ATP-dependent DNA helicase RecQ
MDYNLFLNKYFKGRRDEITKNITPKKFKQIFGELSPAQLGIINDHESKYIVVGVFVHDGGRKARANADAHLFPRGGHGI